MAKYNGEFWDEETLAEELGLKRSSVKVWLHRRGVKRILVADAEQVRKAKAEAPGQGKRTDLGDEPKHVELDKAQERMLEAQRKMEEELWKASRSHGI